MSPRPRSRTPGRASLHDQGPRRPRRRRRRPRWRSPASPAPRSVDPDVDTLGKQVEPALGRHRRRARDLHAGRLRPGRDRLLPGQARRPRGVDELRHLRPRLRRLLPRRLRPSCSAATPLPAHRLRHRARRTRCIGSGDWVFLWKGGFALTDMVGPAAPVPRRSASSSTWWPSWTPSATIPTGAMAERWKWNALRRLGPLLRRHLLPAVRRLDLGRRLAGPARQHDGPRLRLRRLRRLRRRARRRRRRRPRRCHRARASHRQVQQGRVGQHASRATTSRWPCSAASSCCSAGSASTPPRRSRPPTSSSPWWPPTPPSPAAFGAVVGDVLHA